MQSDMESTMCIRGESEVTVIIVAWNSSNDILECLESLLRIRYRNFDVIIVDNNSEDALRDKVGEWASTVGSTANDGCTKFDCSSTLIAMDADDVDNPERVRLARKRANDSENSPRFVIVFSPLNLGFARGNNLGMRIANVLFEPRYFFLLNPDTIVDDNFLDPLVNYMDIHPDVGICSPIQLEYPQTNRILTAGLTFCLSGRGEMNASGLEGTVFERPFEITYASGATMMIRSEILRTIGDLDKKMFVGCEDLDISLRVWLSGSRVVLIPSSVVYHKHHSSIRLKPTEWVVYYGVRSTVRCIVKNLEFRNSVVCLGSFFLRQLTYSCSDLVVRRSPTAFRARLMAFGWNIRNFKETLVDRALVQSRRSCPDSRFLCLSQWKESIRHPTDKEEIG